MRRLREILVACEKAPFEPSLARLRFCARSICLQSSPPSSSPMARIMPSSLASSGTRAAMMVSKRWWSWREREPRPVESCERTAAACSSILVAVLASFLTRASWRPSSRWTAGRCMSEAAISLVRPASPPPTAEARGSDVRCRAQVRVSARIAVGVTVMRGEGRGRGKAGQRNLQKAPAPCARRAL